MNFPSRELEELIGSDFSPKIHYLKNISPIKIYTDTCPFIPPMFTKPGNYSNSSNSRELGLFFPSFSALGALTMLFTLTLGVFLFLNTSWASPPDTVPSMGNKGLAIITTPKGEQIFAEIADTPSKRAKGLMGRTNLAPDRGMLFTFSEPSRWTFWMKNTKISLDIIWLDKKGKVVHLESKVPICTRMDDGCPRYHPSKKASYVLELKAGRAKNFEIQKGSVLQIGLP